MVTTTTTTMVDRSIERLIWLLLTFWFVVSLYDDVI